MRISDWSSDVCSSDLVNMRPPAYLIREGLHALPCIGDGRQSGTSGSASILNASPEAAVGGGLALLKTGDRVRIDLNRGTADMLVPDAELAERRDALEAAGGYPYPASQTPWQEIQRATIGQISSGAILEGAERSEEHTSELQSLMRITYADFCLKKQIAQACKA